ncbi:MAG TPA: hypothetical protein VMW93_04220 [bacterium]|nr:hypothetical protein [bacterium]
MVRRFKFAAVVCAGTLAGPWAATPARAEADVTTVVVAAATAGATTLAALLVKDYFDGKKESERIERETKEILEEVKRIDTRAAAIEGENEALWSRITGARGAVEFWSVLISEDEEFFKPGLVTERASSYEVGLELMFIRNPELIEKVHLAMSEPAGDWERAILIRAYGAGLPGADIWELRKRIDQGLEGGVVLVAGEREARYVSGAENMMAVVDYVREVTGGEGYEETLQKLWGCTPEEVDAVLSAFPQAE